MELTTLVLNFAPPVFLVGFWLFTRFVARGLPIERVSAWRLFSVGGFVAILGLAMAVYIEKIEVGAALVILGAVLGVIGLGRFVVNLWES
jgi:hypothetical protein